MPLTIDMASKAKYKLSWHEAIIYSAIKEIEKSCNTMTYQEIADLADVSVKTVRINAASLAAKQLIMVEYRGGQGVGNQYTINQ